MRQAIPLITVLLLMLNPVLADSSGERILEWHQDDDSGCWYGIDQNGNRWSLNPEPGVFVEVQEGRMSSVMGNTNGMEGACEGKELTISSSQMLEEEPDTLSSEVTSGFILSLNVIVMLVFALVMIGMTTYVTTDENVRYKIGIITTSLYHKEEGTGKKAVEGAFQRGRIMGLLASNQGAHLSAITKTLGFGNNQAAHHLDKLIRDGSVFKRKDGRYLRFYTIEHAHLANHDLPVPAAVRHPDELASRILVKIMGSTGGGLSNQRVLAVELGTSQQLVSYHMKMLEKQGLLVRRRKGLGHQVRLTAEGEEAVSRIMQSN